MKNILLSVIVLCINKNISLAQSPSNAEIISATKQWTYVNSGNPIDGNQRMAFRINTAQLDDEKSFVLSIVNNANSIKIKNSSYSDEDNRDDVYVELKTLGTFDGLDKIFMYFENEKIYYNINFKIVNSNSLLWWNAISDKNDVFISRFNFINKLKMSKQVYFRFVYLEGENINVSFLLNGSAKAINQVVDLSNIKNDDYIMDGVAGVLSLKDFLDSEVTKNKLVKHQASEKDYRSDFYHILLKKLGKYCFTYIRRYEYASDTSRCDTINVFDLNDKMLLQIPWCSNRITLQN
jgi:hypothetical protein